jgi:hypothetical protein
MIIIKIETAARYCRNFLNSIQMNRSATESEKASILMNVDRIIYSIEDTTNSCFKEPNTSQLEILYENIRNIIGNWSNNTNQENDFTSFYLAMTELFLEIPTNPSIENEQYFQVYAEKMSINGEL